MRVLVCGGRYFDDKDSVYSALDEMAKDASLIIHGGAAGADQLAAWWAKDRGIETLVFKPRWEVHGKVSGLVRNQQMLDEGKPDLVVAFIGGRGTADMIDRARKRGIQVCEMTKNIDGDRK